MMQSGKERSILELLAEMKAEWMQRERKQAEPSCGKHSGSRPALLTEAFQLSDMDLPASIRNADLRLKRYRQKHRAAILFVVDASRSQGAKERLAFAKGSVMAILEQAYAKRDKVGMILFGNKKAELVLPYTKSVDFAAERLKPVKAKGNTPLAMGIRLAIQVQEQARRKHPEDLHLTVLLTDGKCNYDVEPGKVLGLTLQAAEEMQKKDLPLLVVDTENSVFGMGIAKKLADAAGGTYVALSQN